MAANVSRGDATPDTGRMDGCGCVELADMRAGRGYPSSPAAVSVGHRAWVGNHSRPDLDGRDGGLDGIGTRRMVGGHGECCFC